MLSFAFEQKVVTEFVETLTVTDYGENELTNSSNSSNLRTNSKINYYCYYWTKKRTV